MDYTIGSITTAASSIMEVGQQVVQSIWYWPVPSSSTITSGVGPRWGTTHKGIDISANSGAEVIATRPGKVVKINTDGVGGGYGNYVVINHNDYITRYAHLLTVKVKEDETVSGGQVIGLVGSTGDSTGPHLHFEIRGGINTDAQVYDPEEFVSYDNSIVAPNKSSSDIASDTLKGGNVPYTPSSVSELRSNQLTGGRPVCPYFKIFLGDKELSYNADNARQNPSIMQRLEFDRLKDAGCSCRFTIFDDNWDEIESYLAKYWDEIYLEYGYADGVISKRYKMLLQDYSISFYNTGVILTISGISQSAYENMNAIDFDTGTKNPTIAIQKICERMGWTIAYLEGSKDTDRDENYKFSKESPVTYIQNVIVPESTDGEGGQYQFYIDSDEYNSVYFRKIDYEKSTEILQDDDPITYIYQRGYDGVVEDLSVDINGVFGGTTNFIYTGIAGTAFGAFDKVETNVSENQDTVTDTATGFYSHTAATQAIARYNTSAESGENMKNRLYYYVKNGTTSQYTAIMRVLGDPLVEIFSHVRLIVLTDIGALHHTSGIYLVKRIVDTIDNGNFFTTLELIRNGDINEGVELRNPKNVVK